MCKMSIELRSMSVLETNSSCLAGVTQDEVESLILQEPTTVFCLIVQQCTLLFSRFCLICHNIQRHESPKHQSCQWQKQGAVWGEGTFSSFMQLDSVLDTLPPTGHCPWTSVPYYPVSHEMCSAGLTEH